MSHLPTERLAALGGGAGRGSARAANEAPTPDELAHLAVCPDCARERLAFLRLADLAGIESTRLGAPLGTWEALRTTLATEQLVPAVQAASAAPIPKVAAVRRPRQRWLQAAAAVLLVSGGVMLGRISAGVSSNPVPGERLATRDASIRLGGAAPAPASTDSTDSTPRFASIEDARAAQERSQLVYQTATAFIAERDTANAPESLASMRARLAALDRARQVMGEALNKAPYDPVLNGYYLTTVGQREATLRQINTAMPASMRISSY